MGGTGVQGAELSPLGPFVATLLAGALVLILPGALLMSVARIAVPLTVIERLAYSGAVSWCVLTVAAIAAFAVGANTPQAAFAILAGSAALGVVWWRRRGDAVMIGTRELVVLAGITIVAVLAYRVGGYVDVTTGPRVGFGWSTMEELLQISTVRKVLEAPSLDVQSIMYAKGEIATYYVPVYPFVLALMSFVSGLDPLVLFDTFRFWTSALSLLAFYAIVAGGFGAAAATVSTLMMLVLLVVGHAGQVPGFVGWGQLIPVSQLGDFGLGVMFPLALAVLVRAAGEPRHSYFFLALFPVLAFAVLLTHTREAAQLGSYLGAGLLVGAVVRGVTGHHWRRLAALLAILVLVSAAYSAFITARVPFIGEHEQAFKARTRVESHLAPISRDSIIVEPPDVPLILRPFTSMGFLLAPLSLYWFRRSPGAVVMIAGIMCWWVPLHIQWAGTLLQRLVYSEIMMSPGRYVIHGAYVLYGVMVFVLFRLLDRSSGTWAIELDPPPGQAGPPTRLSTPLWLVVAVAAVVVVCLPWLAPRTLSARPLWVLGYGIFLLGLIRLARISAPEADEPSRPLFIHRWRVGLVAAVSLLTVLSYGTEGALFALAARRPMPQTADTQRWYEGSGLQRTLPWKVVEMLRTRVPAGSVIAADPKLGLSIPLASDHFVLVSGTNFTTDLHYLEIVHRIAPRQLSPEMLKDTNTFHHLDVDTLPADVRTALETWRRYYIRLQMLVEIAVENHQPIFAQSEDSAITLQLLAALQPDYLLLSGTEHPRLASLVVARPRQFEPIGEVDEVRLYRVLPVPPS